MVELEDKDKEEVSLSVDSDEDKMTSETSDEVLQEAPADNSKQTPEDKEEVSLSVDLDEDKMTSETSEEVAQEAPAQVTDSSKVQVGENGIIETKVDIKTPESIEDQLINITRLSEAQLKEVLDSYNVPDAQGNVAFNDPMVGLKFAARYKELTGAEHEGFKKEASEVITTILRNKNAMEDESYDAQYFETIETVRDSLDGAEGAYEIAYGFPGKRDGWDLKNPQFMDTDALEAFLATAGKKVMFAGEEEMFFEGSSDLLTLARANQIYMQRTGKNHPRYQEMQPELVEQTRALLLNEKERDKRPYVELMMLKGIVDSYDYEEVDLGKELFTEAERKGMLLYETRKDKPLPANGEFARIISEDPRKASFEELKIMLDHIGSREPYRLGKVELQGTDSIKQCQLLNEAYKDFTGGKSHERYLEVVPQLIQAKLDKIGKKGPEPETPQDKKMVERLERLSAIIDIEKAGQKPLSATREEFEYVSKEKTEIQRSSLSIKDKPSEQIAIELNNLLGETRKREISPDEFMLITAMHQELINRHEKINPEVEAYIIRATQSMNKKEFAEPKKEEEDKGVRLTAGAAAVFVTAERFGKIGRGLSKLFRKARKIISRMVSRDKQQEQEQDKTAPVAQEPNSAQPQTKANEGQEPKANEPVQKGSRNEDELEH